jgi:Spy/CpxP family protein refolding chaperone
MKTPVLPVVAALSLAAIPAPAQTVAEKLEITRDGIERQRRVIVAGSLPLTSAEEKAFWPLFDEHQKELRTLDMRADRLIADYVAEYERLTDEHARAMLDEMVRLDEDRARLRRRWVDRMAKALPPRKLARYFQIENKLEALVRADLTRQIPLVP